MAETATRSSGRLGKNQPFPGLSPFEISESAWFFGRGRQTFDLLNRLREIRWIAVVGPSGCGKSSLIKAGVLATLQQGYLGGDWRIVSTRPADSPMNNLVCALEECLPGVSNIESELRSGALGLVGVARQARMAENSRLLILVDQFEELFQFVRRADERSVSARRRGDASAEELAAGSKAVEEAKAFLKLLLTAALSDAAPVYIVITMRSEWLGYCAAYSGLAEAINEGLYLVPEMTRDELRKAIIQPILQAEGLIVSPLVDRMLNDLDGRTDQLPVLQHALKLMWRGRAPGRPLDAEDYKRVGGFAECLSQHAGTIYQKLPKDRQKVTEILFKAITEVTPDNRKVRRQSTVEAIAKTGGLKQAEMLPVLEVFSGEETGFLVVAPVPVIDRSIVDISHEALIRQWDTLKQWVQDEADSRRAMEHLEGDAEAWKKLTERQADRAIPDAERKAKRSGDYLYRGSQLKDAEALSQRPDFLPAPATLAFLQASRAKERRSAMYRWGLAGLVVLLTALALAYYLKGVLKEAETASLKRVLDEQQDKVRAKDREQVDTMNEERVRFSSLVAEICKDKHGDAVKVCGQLSQDTKPAVSLPRRVYMQIGDQNQRAQATACGKLVAAQDFMVQGTEKVVSVPKVTSVRYYHTEEAGAAKQIVDALSGCQVKDAQATLIKGYDNVRPGHFEIWFSLPPSAQ